MIIYKAQIYDKDEGAMLSWHSSEVAAKKHVREYGSGKQAQGPEGVQQVVIEGGKKGLLEWLNANFTRDNG